jgi:ABC-type Na+ efflux pump permease subunit
VKGFGAVARAEMSDLTRAPLVWIGLLATAGAAWVRGRYAPFHNNGWTVYETALQAAAQAASFFLLGAAAVSIAGERTRGTVRWLLPRPIARSGFVLGKAAALGVAALVFLAVAVSVSWTIARPYGFGDVKTEDVAAFEDDGGGFEGAFIEDEVVPPAFQAATLRTHTAWATLLVLPALLFATGIGLLVSSLMRSSSGAVIVAIGVAIPLYWLPEVVGLSPRAAQLLPFRAASEYLDAVQAFGRRLATAEWPAYGGTARAGTLLAFGLPTLAAALFARLDLTD